jgi:hypothetical protein
MLELTAHHDWSPFTTVGRSAIVVFLEDAVELLTITAFATTAQIVSLRLACVN